MSYFFHDSGHYVSEIMYQSNHEERLEIKVHWDTVQILKGEIYAMDNGLERNDGLSIYLFNHFNEVARKKEC